MKSFITKLSIAGVGLITLTLIVATVSYAQSPLLKHVIAMWLFDDVGRPRVIEDASGNGHDAQVRNGPKVVKGKFGTAMRFNGAFHAKTYLEVRDHEALQPTDVISIVAWVKRPLEVKDIAPYYILAKGWEWQFDTPSYGLALHKVFDNMFYSGTKEGFRERMG